MPLKNWDWIIAFS